MNKKQYIEKLEKQNGYCECLQLQKLYLLRRKTEELADKCDFFQREANFENPRESDLQFLEDYKRTAKNLRKSAEIYYTRLADEVERGNVQLILNEQGRQRKISIKTMAELRKSIVTANCAYCEQQIDILD